MTVVDDNALLGFALITTSFGSIEALGIDLSGVQLGSI